MKLYKYYISACNLVDNVKINFEAVDDDLFSPWLPSSDGEVMDHCLYAHTNNKQISKEFEKSRNMKLFIKSVSKCTKKDYEQYVSLHPSGNIIRSQLYMKGVDEFGNIKTDKCEYLLTDWEEYVTKTQPLYNEVVDKIFNQNFWKNLPNINSYSEDMRRVLSILEYDTFRDYIVSDVPDSVRQYAIDRFYQTELDPNQLAIFIYYFGNLLTLD